MDVMIVDDEPVARRTVRECCEREPDLTVVGEYGDPRTALEAIRAGTPGTEADAVARDAIIADGYGDEFGHGLGHGVGIEVHEAPRLSKRSEETLEVGDVVTVEPGVYLPGRFGVRVEDLVMVTDNGCRNLSGVAKDLRVVD